MPRVITSLAVDLTMEALSTPPHLAVGFTEVDPAGRESHGQTRFADADAAALLTSILNAKTTQGMLDAVSAAIDVQASAVALPTDLAAKITAAADADTRARNAVAAADAADTRAAKAASDLAAATAALAATNAQIAAAQSKPA